MFFTEKHTTIIFLGSFIEIKLHTVGTSLALSRTYSKPCVDLRVCVAEAHGGTVCSNKTEEEEKKKSDVENK